MSYNIEIELVFIKIKLSLHWFLRQNEGRSQLDSIYGVHYVVLFIHVFSVYLRVVPKVNLK